MSFEEQIMSKDKYPCIFLCQIETIVFIIQTFLYKAAFWETFSQRFSPIHFNNLFAMKTNSANVNRKV